MNKQALLSEENIVKHLKDLDWSKTTLLYKKIYVCPENIA